MIWVQIPSTRSSWSWRSKKNLASEIPDDAAETILTVGDAVKFIEKAQA